MRCFIALDIDETAQNALKELQHKLKKEVDLKRGDMKWVDPEKIHLTLKFLGDTKDEVIPEMCRALEKAVSGHKNFDLSLSEIGYFGGKSARVIWVGCDKGSRKLGKLQADIENEMDKFGVPKEKRKFFAHLTLARVKNYKAGIKLKKLINKDNEFNAGPIIVDSVILYQSQLQSDGPVYTKLGTFNLK